MKRQSNPIRKDYTDPAGIPSRVLVPEGETDLSTGIPVSLDLSPLYPHMPPEWLRALYEALHAQGLVEAPDFFKPGADQRAKAALLSVIRSDFLNMQAIAKQELDK